MAGIGRAGAEPALLRPEGKEGLFPDRVPAVGAAVPAAVPGEFSVFQDFGGEAAVYAGAGMLEVVAEQEWRDKKSTLFAMAMCVLVLFALAVAWRYF